MFVELFSTVDIEVKGRQMFFRGLGPAVYFDTHDLLAIYAYDIEGRTYYGVKIQGVPGSDFQPHEDWHFFVDEKGKDFIIEAANTRETYADYYEILREVAYKLRIPFEDYIKEHAL